MHVLYVIDSLDRPGGAEQALAAMAPHLMGAGVTLDIAYLTERPGFQDDLRDAGAHVVPVLEPGRLPRTRALAGLIRQRRPDLVHTTLYEADLAGRWAAAATRTPVVSSLVNVAYGPEHRDAPELSARKVRAAQLADAASCRTVRRFHALTDYVAGIMSRRLLIRRSRIDVVPRGRDLAVLGDRSAERRHAVRQRIGLADDVPVVVAAARHEYQKGLDTLVSAFAEIRRAQPDAQLVIAGREGTATELLRRRADEGGVTGCVHLLGPRTDVPDLIAAADVFAAPSRWEGLGSAVLEAMGIGTPVVAGDVAAIRETITGEGALLVPVSDPSALARAVVDALGDPAAAAARAEVASCRFRSRNTIQRVSEAMLDFYGRALG
ncbi:glycosyltransferase [Nocardioides sp. GXQ0305]|uniref:glycosyltransferase n=1 Tax=Nocardioides sp. GXQ0305 TaxID=3423912 RepID=UPI003D7CDCE0